MALIGSAYWPCLYGGRALHTGTRPQKKLMPSTYFEYTIHLFEHILLVFVLEATPNYISLKKNYKKNTCPKQCPGLDQIFIRLGLPPPTPPSLPGLPTRTCVELLLVGNHYDNTRSELQIFKLTSLSSFPS